MCKHLLAIIFDPNMIQFPVVNYIMCIVWEHILPTLWGLQGLDPY